MNKELKIIFDQINKYCFGNKLKNICIYFSKTILKNAYGLFYPYRKPKIIMTKELSKNNKLLYKKFIHEIVHYYLFVHGFKYGHTKQFYLIYRKSLKTFRF